MKVLFLDIDGVLCLHKESDLNWSENPADDLFDAQCCRRLREIIEITGCKLVLSSFWRLHREDIRNMLKQLRPFGVLHTDFVGKTALMARRSDEIMAYISRHRDITSYVAVDDEDLSRDGFPADRLVLTEIEHGITEAVKNAAIRKLLDSEI